MCVLFIDKELKVIKTCLFLIFISFPINCIANFEVYESTLFKNKPSSNIFNIKTIPIIYETHFFGNNKDNNLIPDKIHIDKIVNTINKSNLKSIVLDIERWPLRGGKQMVTASILKYKKVVKMLRDAGIKKRIGYYGAPPIRDYWRAIKGEQSIEYENWKNENNIIQTLANDVDVLYPSLYTFYRNKEKWKTYAIAQISEARRMANNKTVIVFLSPQYHSSNLFLKGKYVSKEFWRLQLDTVFKYADGLIIWGGWKQEWDSNSPWWKETIQFMEDNDLINN